MRGRHGPFLGIHSPSPQNTSRVLLLGWRRIGTSQCHSITHFRFGYPFTYSVGESLSHANIFRCPSPTRYVGYDLSICCVGKLGVGPSLLKSDEFPSRSLPAHHRPAPIRNSPKRGTRRLGTSRESRSHGRSASPCSLCGCHVVVHHATPPQPSRPRGSGTHGRRRGECRPRHAGGWGLGTAVGLTLRACCSSQPAQPCRRAGARSDSFNAAEHGHRARYSASHSVSTTVSVCRARAARAGTHASRRART